MTGLEQPFDACAVALDTPEPVLNNRLSMLTASEFYKRLVMTRENAASAYPRAEWPDVREIMYGPAESELFPGLAWGGATTDTAIFVQSGARCKNARGRFVCVCHPLLRAGLDMRAVEENSKGDWRILSKLGSGCGDVRPPGRLCEIVNHAYACLPVAGAQNAGVEFVLSVFGADATVCEADVRVQANVARVVAAIVAGEL